MDPSSPHVRSAEEVKGSVCFAQDREGRHIAIKLVPADAETDERKIYQFLHTQDQKVLEENCVLPVLDILLFNEHCFVVMPRWGSRMTAPAPMALREVIDLIRGCLKGLAFLHKHGIIHRDISWGNYLVNHFSSSDTESRSHLRGRLRAHGKLAYAIYDYNISIFLPPDVSRKGFRLPYNMTWEGTYFNVPDVSAGELDYDPFAYDVGVLGYLLSLDYQHLCPDLHLLAPLIDGMTTRTIRKRFTANQALEFLKANLDTLTDDKLEKAFYKPGQYVLYYLYDGRWDQVPDDLAQRWDKYKEPPLPRTAKFMRWICEIEKVASFIRIMRRVGRLFYTRR